MKRAGTLVMGLLALFLCFCSTNAFAGWPGQCNGIWYYIEGTYTNTNSTNTYTTINQNQTTGALQISGSATVPANSTMTQIKLGFWYYDYGATTPYFNTWSSSTTAVGPVFMSALAAKNPIQLPINTAAALKAAYPACVAPCPAPGTNADPILVGMPYHAAYYDTVGVCSDGCVKKPITGVTLDSYAADGSGYAIGPWQYTGAHCTAGVTPDQPQQPSPEDQCDAQRNACEAKCEGRAYTFDCDTGSCECFGAPSYTTDPPKNPTTPTSDPGSPAVPSPQTAATDPGVGGNQLGAQIQNQGKQIAQGDSQLDQLGGINNKLGAVINNQGKQLAQGDTMIDYQRRQLGAIEDIRNKLGEGDGSSNPGVPDEPDFNTDIGNEKNWTEHDNPEQVGQARAARDIAKNGSVQSSPVNIDIQTSPSSSLTGIVLGQSIEIRFNMPWMLTLYSIMKVVLVGLAYLQVFFMINRTLIER